jgi:hypothetical protein
MNLKDSFLKAGFYLIDDDLCVAEEMSTGITMTFYLKPFLIEHEVFDKHYKIGQNTKVRLPNDKKLILSHLMEDWDEF